MSSHPRLTMRISIVLGEPVEDPRLGFLVRYTLASGKLCPCGPDVLDRLEALTHGGILRDVYDDHCTATMLREHERTLGVVHLLGERGDLSTELREWANGPRRA